MEKDYIKNQFATYEIALKLKELGFDEPCLGCYYDDIVNKEKGILHIEYIDFKDSIIHTEEHSYSISCLAPLWQQVIDWFREEHKLDIYPEPTYSLSEYSFKIVTVQGKSKRQEYWNGMVKTYESYQKAREQAILKCIELCQKGK